VKTDKYCLILCSFTKLVCVYHRAKERKIDDEPVGCPGDCPEEKAFRKFFDSVKNIVVNVEENRGTENAETYHKILMNQIQVIDPFSSLFSSSFKASVFG